MEKVKVKVVAVTSIVVIALCGVAMIVVGPSGASPSYDPALDTVGPMWAVIDAGSLDTIHRLQPVDAGSLANETSSLSEQATLRELLGISDSSVYISDRWPG